MSIQNFSFTSLHLPLGLLLAIALNSTGCVSHKTRYRHHIKRPKTTLSPPKSEQLIEELQHPLDRDDHTPAEQIAAYAAHALQEGHPWDSAVLLSLASYRYYQQARMVTAIGLEQAHLILPVYRDLFDFMVDYEFRILIAQDFDDEIDLLREYLFGRAILSERHDEYLEMLAQGGKEDDTFAQRMKDISAELSNRPEQLVHPRLADVFLARLVKDHRMSSETYTTAFHYLAATPLDKFRLVALDEVKIPFSGLLVRNIVPRMQTLGKQVRGRLGSGQANTRAHVAAILGLSSDPADIALLEDRLQHESHGAVIDSIRFALIHHGKKEHLEPLVDRVTQTIFNEERDHLLTLLLWLPPETKTTLDEALFIKIARERLAVGSFGRKLALLILGEIASQRALGQESVMALLELTNDEDEEVAKTASHVVQALEQLGATECKTLYPKYPKAHAALVSRLGAVASLGDLEFLGRVYDESNEVDVRAAAVIAVSKIPGAASLDLLKRWMVEAGSAERRLPEMLFAIRLASRTDVDQAELQRLKLSRLQRLTIQIALDSPGLARSAAFLHGGHGTRQVQSNGHPSGASAWTERVSSTDIMQVVMLSKFFGRRALMPTLWKLARYDEDYPFEIAIRRYAMSALVRLVLLRHRAERFAGTSASR